MTEQALKFGVRLLDDLGGAKELVSLGALAEELGFDTLWFPHDAFRLNSWVLHSALAERTSKIELCARANPYTMDPSEIATFAATLDDLSGGRVTLALGLHNLDTITWVGMEGSRHLQRVRESASIVRQLLDGATVETAGTEFTNWTQKAYLRMPPQRKAIPIIISAVGEEFLELSGEIGNGSMPMVTPPASATLMMESIQKGLSRSSDPDRTFDKCAFVWMSISESRGEAASLLADVIAYFGTYLEPRAVALLGLTVEDFVPAYDRIMAQDREGARRLVTEPMLRTGICGTPEECVRQLQPIVQAGFTHISIGGPLGRDPREAMRLIAEQVVPAFK